LQSILSFNECSNSFSKISACVRHIDSRSYCILFLLYGFDAVTLSDANARILDRRLDRAVYRIFGVCDKNNVSSLRTLLGLHSVSNAVKNRRAKLPDGLLDTGGATLMHKYCINCLGSCIPVHIVICISVCVFISYFAAVWRIKTYIARIYLLVNFFLSVSLCFHALHFMVNKEAYIKTLSEQLNNHQYLLVVASFSVVPLCDHATEKPEPEVTSSVDEQMSWMESPGRTRSGR